MEMFISYDSNPFDLDFTIVYNEHGKVSRLIVYEQISFVLYKQMITWAQAYIISCANMAEDILAEIRA